MKRQNLFVSLASIVTVVSATAFLAGGCSGSSSSSPTGSGSRTLTALDTATSTVNNGCTLVTRDTTSCQAARTALGLSGNWLGFSCNVVLGLTDANGNTVTSTSNAAYVTVAFHDLPDYSSNFYVAGSTYNFTANGSTVTGSFGDLSNTFSPTYPNPSNIAQQSITMSIPYNPTKAGSTQTMGMGMIGVTINGVAIYDNVADSTDSIFTEEYSFDQCKGHPSNENNGTYHYHSEPYSISFDDNNLIGVMLDGFFVFGRKDHDGTDVSVTGTQSTNLASTTGTDMLYIYGGHTGADPQSGTGSTFHYHLTQFTACTHYTGSRAANDLIHYPDDGQASCFCTGSSVGNSITIYSLTGHGNGATYATFPTGTSEVSNGSDTCTTGGTTYTNSMPNNSLSGSATAIRYYYGTPGTCTGCN